MASVAANETEVEDRVMYPHKPLQLRSRKSRRCPDLMQWLFIAFGLLGSFSIQASEYRCRDNVTSQSGICADPIIGETQAYFPYYGDGPSPRFASLDALLAWQDANLAPLCTSSAYLTSTKLFWDITDDKIYQVVFSHTPGANDCGYLEAWVIHPKPCPAGFQELSSNGLYRVPSSTNRFPCFKPDDQIYGGCTAGDPVRIFDGSVLERERDYDSTANRLKVYRNYRSIDGGQGVEAVGAKWTLSLTAHVVPARYGQPFPTVIRSTGEPQFLLQSGTTATSVFDADILVQTGSGWQYRDDKDKSISEFNMNGKLQSRTLKDGARLTYTYSDASTPTTIAPEIDLLIAVTDNFGRAIKVSYDAGKFVKSIVDPAGSSISYGFVAAPNFDSLRDLSEVKYQDGSSRKYQYLEPASNLIATTYSKSGLLTSVVDELNASVANFTYRADISTWRASTVQSAGGVDKYLFQGYAAGYSDVTDPLGSIRRYRGTAIGIGDEKKVVELGRDQPGGSGCSAASMNVVNYPNGDVFLKDDFNQRRVCYAYGSPHKEISRVEGIDNSVDCYSVRNPNAILPAGSRKTSTTWHPDWRIETAIASPGKITTFVYQGQPDPFNGNVVAACAPSNALLPDGKPITVLCKEVNQATTDSDGHLGFTAQLQAGVANRISQWTYNQYGQVLTAKDPLNNTKTYAYYSDTAFVGSDPNAVGHTTGDLMTMTNAAGKVYAFTKYDKHGHVLEMQDPNGVLFVNTFDLRQRLLSTAVGSQTTYFLYDQAGQLLKATGPDGSWIGYEYDAAHRQTAVKNNIGNRIEYLLDNAGNRISENVKDASGTLRRQVARNIDSLGRIKQTTGKE